jgi:hypothetical protein
MNFDEKLPSMFLVSSDGFSNSHKTEDEFKKTCQEYFETINQYGTKTVGENLKDWLFETSSMGCGDDITTLMAYYSSEDGDEIRPEVAAEDMKSEDTETHPENNNTGNKKGDKQSAIEEKLASKAEFSLKSEVIAVE